MHQTLKDLSHCDDIGSVESALRTLCSEFGPMSKLDVLPLVGAGKRQAVCLLRLNSSAKEQDLMTKLGAVRFGQDLCVVVDLRMPA
ncbi:MAG TPA: hypothetical protein VMV87_14725 [Burkholderiales bacterium]|nr:hypothetical protein [Burkholderiales bacterium]